MPTPTVESPPSLARRRLWGSVAALTCALALGMFLGRDWIRDWLDQGEALQLVEEKHFDAALPILLRIHERRPNNVAVTRALALGYLHGTRELAETRKYLDRWCELQPGAAEPFKQRMGFWMMQEMVAPAISDAEHVLHVEPNDAETRGKLVQLLLTAGRYPEAEKEGLQSFKENPQNVDLWYILANIYQGLGRGPEGEIARKKATDLTDQVLVVAPDHMAALKLRAKLYIEAGQPEQAIRLLKERVVGAPSSDGTQGLYELGEALTRAGRDDEAKQVFTELEWRQTLGLWSNHEYRDANVGLQTRVVEAMLAAGKVDDAVQFLSGILARNRQAPPAVHELLAVCYDKQSKPELALEQRRQAQLKQKDKEKRGQEEGETGRKGDRVNK
jgi:tetratricopeptide (TPR) repeat protein